MKHKTMIIKEAIEIIKECLKENQPDYENIKRQAYIIIKTLENIKLKKVLNEEI